MSAVPIIDPVYPPGTPANIIQAYMNNVNCICAAGDPSCSNCLTVSPEYLLESRDAPAIAGIIAVPIIAFIVVVMRTYSRAFIIRKLGMDDWLTLVTFVSEPESICCTHASFQGRGKSRISISDRKLTLSSFSISLSWCCRLF